MLDRTIPFYNTILKCTSWQYKEVSLPSGFSIVAYEKGYEKSWAKMEESIGDFPSLQAAENYFAAAYTQNQDLLSNVRFLLKGEEEVIGSCIAWQDKDKSSFVSSLHWLIVDEKYHGMGLGKALCCDAMNIFWRQGRFPVYIHTQPWSWKAIFLYLSLGFKLQKKDTFSHYKNEYYQAMNELKKIVREEQFKVLQESSES